MGYDFRCNACRFGHRGEPGNTGYQGDFAGIATTWRDDDCFTEWCVDEQAVTWCIPDAPSDGSHDGHDHRRFPRERSGCVACPVCGSADIETRD